MVTGQPAVVIAMAVLIGSVVGYGLRAIGEFPSQQARTAMTVMALVVLTFLWVGAVREKNLWMSQAMRAEELGGYCLTTLTVETQKIRRIQDFLWGWGPALSNPETLVRAREEER